MGLTLNFSNPIRKNWGERPKIFLTVGCLAPRKGLEDLLTCVKIVLEKNENIEFWIAGSGPYERRLMMMAKSKGVINYVKFLGHISDRRELVSLYQGAYGYLHPAHYEGLPTVLLEAMACGLPVVATAVAGALDVISDGINGLLVPVCDPERLAEKVITLLDNPQLGDDLGQVAIETIQQRYSWEVVGQNHIAVYKSFVIRK